MYSKRWQRRSKSFVEKSHSDIEHGQFSAEKDEWSVHSQALHSVFSHLQWFSVNELPALMSKRGNRGNDYRNSTHIRRQYYYAGILYIA